MGKSKYSGARLAALAALFLGQCLASNQAVIRTKQDGWFEFSELRFKQANPGSFCRIEGSIANHTTGTWKDNDFTLIAIGSGHALTLNLHIDQILFGSTETFDKYCVFGGPGHYIPFPTFEPTSFSGTFEGGYWEKSPEQLKAEATAASAKRAAKAKADATKAAAEAKARADYLARFPTIMSGFTSAFIGSDKKCSAQFLEATAMEGLEKRKRLADLITFGCGFIARNGAHVAVDQKDGKFAEVRMIDGDKAGKSGWVPISWVVK